MDTSTVISLALAVFSGLCLIIAVKADGDAQKEEIARAYRMGKRAGRREYRQSKEVFR